MTITRARTEEQRAAKIAERRAALLTVARCMFHQHGYRGFTMSALAAELGWSVGAIYLYFKSDLEIYAELLRVDLGGCDTAQAVLECAKKYMPDELRQEVIAAEAALP